MTMAQRRSSGGIFDVSGHSSKDAHGHPWTPLSCLRSRRPQVRILPGALRVFAAQTVICTFSPQLCAIKVRLCASAARGQQTVTFPNDAYAGFVPKRSTRFQEDVSVFYSHLADGASIEESAMLTNRVTGEKLEVHVVLRTRSS